MGLLSNLERRLDQIVNGSFSKAFKSQVDPVELAAALQQELDLQAQSLDGRVTVPNVFVFELGSADYKRLEPFLPNLASELAAVAKDYIIDQRYTVIGRLAMSFDVDTALETGTVRIRSEATREAEPTTRPVDPSLRPQVPASVTARPSTPRLIAVAGTEFPLTKAITTVGRSERADVRISDGGASRMHCEILLGSQVMVRDLSSTNGTIVDGARVHEAVLTDGSIIRVGETTLTYKSR